MLGVEKVIELQGSAVLKLLKRNLTLQKLANMPNILHSLHRDMMIALPRYDPSLKHSYYRIGVLYLHSLNPYSSIYSPSSSSNFREITNLLGATLHMYVRSCIA